MYQFDVVCHLAAQAGVRYSVEVPEVYVTTNVLGTQTIFEVMQNMVWSGWFLLRHRRLTVLLLQHPFVRTSQLTDQYLSRRYQTFIELLAYNYFAQYGIETTCLRFFTVYGPWSRPDMAMLKFAEKITRERDWDL